jgi:glycine cleavage system aminomethyltransferase T
MHDLLGGMVDEMKYYFWTRATVKGIPVVVTRTGWTSEVGYEIYLLDKTKGTELWQAVMDAGKPYGVKPTGPSDIRRIEGAIFNWGADMNYDNNPLEMGLERLIAWDLQDSAAISMAALRRIKAAGVTRRIVGVEIDGAPFPALNFVRWDAFRDGALEAVGQVTSAIYSPRLKKNIGFCWVPADWAAPGSKLGFATYWGDRSATVVPMPFVDPEKRIPVG